MYEHGDKQGNVMDEWEPVAKYAPEFADTDLDILQEVVDQDYFQFFQNCMESNAVLQDVLLAHKVIESGLPNR